MAEELCFLALGFEVKHDLERGGLVGVWVVPPDRQASGYVGM